MKSENQHWLRRMFERVVSSRNTEEVIIPKLKIEQVTSSNIPSLEDWMDTEKKKFIQDKA